MESALSVLVMHEIRLDNNWYIISVYFNFVKFVCLDTLEKTVHCHVLFHYMEKDVKGSVTVTQISVTSLQGVKFGHQV